MISQSDKEYIKQNAANLTINEMFEYFNKIYTKKQIKNFCNNNNIIYRKMTHEERSIASSNRSLCFQRKQTPINHDYFKTWSRNMAYVFGLWCADGYISSKNNIYQFSIKLHKNDKYLLQKILKDMESNHNIYENKDNTCLINIGSKTIVQDILKLGGKEAKSLDLEFPVIPREFIADFIRGYFDGDGCITFNKTKNAFFVSISSGSKIFLVQMLDKLRSICGIRGSICKNNKNKFSNTYKIVLGKEDTIKFGKFIYKNNPDLKLNRKYEKFISKQKE